MLDIVYHVREKKSNVFMPKNQPFCKKFLCKIAKLQIFVDKARGLWLNATILKGVDGKFALFQCCREPVVGANRCGGSGRSDS